jgi:hypothetical protein
LHPQLGNHQLLFIFLFILYSLFLQEYKVYNKEHYAD